LIFQIEFDSSFFLFATKVVYCPAVASAFGPPSLAARVKMGASGGGLRGRDAL
jgi:hypothetical protein